ncbi:MAG: ArsC/Spx/MgsR family protein [Pararhodobacter sp.]
MIRAVEIWHNPRCSKSRQALAGLEAKGITPVIRLYLTEPPSDTELRAMLTALRLPAAALLRKDAGVPRDASESEILTAMAADPALIERPVIRHGERAVIGRPTGAIDTFF